MKNAEVIKVLRNASNGIFDVEGFDRVYGLCFLIGTVCDRPDLERIFKSVVHEWEKFSGDPLFPIASPYPDVINRDAYIIAPDLWGDSDYAKSRKELAGWFADYMEKNRRFIRDE